MREADVGSQFVDTIKLSFSSRCGRSPLGSLSTEVARADAKHKKMQQFSTRPLQNGRSRLHSKNKNLHCEM
jgi:hypothetical protein